MKCLLCSLTLEDEMELKNHYVNYHGLAHDNYSLCKLFEKEERGGTTCWHCRRLFKDNRGKRIHMFLTTIPIDPRYKWAVREI